GRSRVMAHDMISSSTVLPILQDLIRIPSVNPLLAPDEAHGEAAIARFAREWFASRDIRSWLEEAAPNRPNAVAEVGGKAGPSLLLCADLDTVATAGMTIPAFEPRVEDNRVYGRGSYDMKGGAAAVMMAAAELAKRDFPGRVLVALVADEEHSSVGAY